MATRFKTTLMRNELPTAVIALSLVSYSLLTTAHTSIDFNVSIAPPPPLPVNVVVDAPAGYEACYTTEDFWDGSVWIPAHEECIYTRSSGRTLWVSGYWGCLFVRHNGGCGRWKWYSHHWTKDLRGSYWNHDTHYHGGHEPIAIVQSRSHSNHGHYEHHQEYRYDNHRHGHDQRRMMQDPQYPQNRGGLGASHPENHRPDGHHGSVHHHSNH